MPLLNGERVSHKEMGYAISHVWISRHPEYIQCNQNANIFRLGFEIRKLRLTLKNLERVFKLMRPYMKLRGSK